MISTIWRKRFSILQNKLYLYPEPDPMPRTSLFWISIGLVTVAALLFSSYFIFYLTGRHDAFLTNAEDFGIMDQAVWNTLHGHILHQTICNILFDTNCYTPSGINRFAIHFEPILFPVSLFYLIWSDPRVLLVVQTLVVASGVYPAFLLARLRLRNELASVAIALLYLLYPAQQQATVFDFHAVTFTVSLLLFAIYFMYTRRTVWLFVFAILAMACKEEIPLVVLMLGLWSMVFQRRWRSGLGLVVLALAWVGLAFLMIHLYSPTGKPLLTSRYGNLGNGPVQIILNIVFHPVAFIKQYILEHDRLDYLRSLASPAGYLPLLTPWVLIIALPTLALNLLSSDAQMYSGLFQYNAEIVPILIFSTIESVRLILWLVQIMMAKLERQGRTKPLSARFPRRVMHVGTLIVLIGLFLFSSIRSDYYFHGQMPFSIGFDWPTSSTHVALVQNFINMIPPTASVSAQSKLVPHLSHRESIYLFPYADNIADYDFLDVTSDIYPYIGSSNYVNEAKNVLLSGNYGIVAAQDGYLLLKRKSTFSGISSDLTTKPVEKTSTTQKSTDLPDGFCSYIYISPKYVTHPLKVNFTGQDGSMDLVGFNLNIRNTKGTVSRSSDYLTLTTYWQVSRPIMVPLQILIFARGENGKEYLVSVDVPQLLWCQTNTWEVGKIVQMTSSVFSFQSSKIPNGLAYMSIALVPLVQSSSTMMNVQDRLPLHVANAPSTVTSAPGTNALQLRPITLVK